MSLAFSPAVVAYLVVASTVAALIWMLRGSFWLFSILCLPSTFTHELLHWLTGFFSNAQPTRLSIIPRRSGDSYVLGSVMLRNVRWYNGWLVGLAPLLLLPCAYMIALNRADALTLIPSLLDFGLLYLTAQMLLGCIPSVQDMKIVVFNSWWILVLLGLAILRHHY